MNQHAKEQTASVHVMHALVHVLVFRVLALARVEGLIK
jgi:hypothetical protein